MTRDVELIDQQRRVFMKGALGVGAAGLVVGTGLFSIAAYAAPDASSWPKEAFAAEDLDKAIKALYGQAAVDSDKITLDMPTIAQNGAVVPLTVDAKLDNVSSIAIMVAKNPYALAAMFEIPEGTLPYVSNRIKMGETSDVIALVESGGKLYKTSRNVKVTVGGCGG